MRILSRGAKCVASMNIDWVATLKRRRRFVIFQFPGPSKSAARNGMVGTLLAYTPGSAQMLSQLTERMNPVFAGQNTNIAKVLPYDFNSIKTLTLSKL